MLAFKQVNAGSAGANSIANAASPGSGFFTFYEDATAKDVAGLADSPAGTSQQQCLAACTMDEACAAVLITQSGDAARGFVSCGLIRPPAVPNFGEMTEIRRAAFMTKWAAPGPRTEAAWRRAEIPSANGHADALSLARLLGMMACGGRLDGRRVLRRDTIEDASKERIVGQDLVLPYVMSWGAGFMRNSSLAIYGPSLDAFGHSGWGGSCAFADPQRRVSGAYVMNRQSPDLLGDPRSRRLIDTAYSCL